MPDTEDAAEILKMAATDPLGTADRLEAMAARLTNAARLLREAAAQETQAPAGLGDRVMMQVRGPNGELRQSTDTQRN